MMSRNWWFLIMVLAMSSLHFKNRSCLLDTIMIYLQMKIITSESGFKIIHEGENWDRNETKLEVGGNCSSWWPYLGVYCIILCIFYMLIFPPKLFIYEIILNILLAKCWWKSIHTNFAVAVFQLLKLCPALPPHRL